MWALTNKRYPRDANTLVDAWRELRSACPEQEYQHVLLCALIGQEKRIGKDADIRRLWQLEISEQAWSVQNVYPNFVYALFLSFGLGRVLCKKAERLLRIRCFEALQGIDQKLLLGGYLRPDILFRQARVAFLRFRFSSAFHVCALVRAWFPRWQPGPVALFQGQCAQLCARPEDTLALYAQAFLEYGLPVEVAAPGYEASLRSNMGDFPWQKSLALAQAGILRHRPVRRAQSLILAGEFQAAEELLRRLPLWRRHSVMYAVILARSCLFQGKREAAKATLEGVLRKRGSCVSAYNEAIRVCCFSGDRAWGEEIWNATVRRRLSLTPVLEWQLLCGLGRLPEAFARHGRARYFHVLDPYLGEKLLPGLPSREGGRLKTLLILSECFPGDEFRFARFYPLMVERANAERVIFTCDPRMRDILQRSFPQLEFLPVRRVQSVVELGDYTAFNQLPDIECCRYLDNKGWEVARSVDGAVTVMHALADIVENYEQLAALPRLVVDPERQAGFEAWLAPCRPAKLVGLSWRSMQSRFDRNWANFSLKELEPVLHMDGVQFINCQYDGCTTEEKEFLSTRFPGKVLDVPGLDQKQDVDGAAALYKCLDAMVTAPTYTCEISGVIGTPTIIFAGSRVPELFTSPGTDHHAFLGINSHIICAFDGRERTELVNRIRKKLASLLKLNQESALYSKNIISKVKKL